MLLTPQGIATFYGIPLIYAGVDTGIIKIKLSVGE